MAYCLNCKKEIDTYAAKCPHCNYSFKAETFIEDKLRHKFVRHTIVAVFLFSVFCFHVFSVRHYYRNLGEIILTFMLIPIYIPYVILGGVPSPRGLVSFPDSFHAFGLMLFLVAVGMVGAYIYSIFILSINRRISRYNDEGEYLPSRTVLIFFISCFLIVFIASFETYKYDRDTIYNDRSMYKISCSNNLKQIGLALRMYSNVYEENFPPYNGAKGLGILRSGGFLEHKDIYLCPTVEYNNYDGKRISGNELLLTDYDYCGGFKESDPKDTPIAWDKSSNHKNYRHVLFIDGHVKHFTDKEWKEKIYPRLKALKAAKKAEPKYRTY